MLSPATPSRSTTLPGNSAAASTTMRPSPSYIAWPTTWNSLGDPKHEHAYAEYSSFATPPCPSSTFRSRYPSWPMRPSRAMCSSGYPDLFDAIATPLLHTTSRQKPFKNYLTLLSAKLCGTTCVRSQLKADIGNLSLARAPPCGTTSRTRCHRLGNPRLQQGPDESWHSLPQRRSLQRPLLLQTPPTRTSYRATPTMAQASPISQ